MSPPHLFLGGPQAKNDFYIFKWLKSIHKKDISRDVKIVWNSTVSTNKVLNFVNKKFVGIFLSRHVST